MLRIVRSAGGDLGRQLLVCARCSPRLLRQQAGRSRCHQRTLVARRLPLQREGTGKPRSHLCASPARGLRTSGTFCGTERISYSPDHRCDPQRVHSSLCWQPPPLAANGNRTCAGTQGSCQLLVRRSKPSVCDGTLRRRNSVDRARPSEGNQRYCVGNCSERRRILPKGL